MGLVLSILPSGMAMEGVVYMYHTSSLFLVPIRVKCTKADREVGESRCGSKKRVGVDMCVRVCGGLGMPRVAARHVHKAWVQVRPPVGACEPRPGQHSHRMYGRAEREVLPNPMPLFPPSSPPSSHYQGSPLGMHIPAKAYLSSSMLPQCRFDRLPIYQRFSPWVSDGGRCAFSNRKKTEANDPGAPCWQAQRSIV